MWVLSGPAGIGKTRLLRWLEEDAQGKGFDIHWAYCLKETNSAYFPFYQIFRPTDGEAERPPGGDGGTPGLPTVQIYEEERPTRLIQRAIDLSQGVPTILITREKEETLRQKHPHLAPGTKIIWLTRVEGRGGINPTSLDGLGEALDEHMRTVPGSVVGITNLEYLISQNSFLPVLRLVQFLRDSAETSGGHVLVSVNPAALEKREVALLEGEGEVAGHGGETQEAERAGTEPPAQTMMRYLQRFEDWSHRRPQVFFFDDLQWADPPSLQAVQFLARNIRTLPVLLVASVRNDDVITETERQESPLNEILDDMGREGTLTDLPVKKLDEFQLAQLCQAILGAPPHLGPGEGSLTPLIERTGGNPYFLMEMVRQLKEDDHFVLKGSEMVMVPRRDAHSGETSELPDTLRRLVLRRLKMLTPEERRILELAAVAGSEFDGAMVAANLTDPHSDVTTKLERMASHHHLLEPLPGAHGRWTFAHPLVWEGTLSEIPGDRLRADAATLARWMSTHHPEEEAVARLTYLARDTAEGPRWVRRAIDKALSEHASQTVERYHRWLQELYEAGEVDPGTRLEVGLEVATRLFVSTGGSAAMRRILRMLTELPARPGLRGLARAYLIYLDSDIPPQEILDMALGMEAEMLTSTEPSPPLTRVLTRGSAGNSRFALGDFRGSLEAYREGLRLAKEAAAPRWLLAHLYYDAGWVANDLRYEEEFREDMARGQALAQEPGLERFAAHFLGLEANSLIHTGMLRRAEEIELRCLGIMRAAGGVPSCAASLWNLCSLYITLGETERARAYLAEGRTLAQRFGLRFHELTFLIPACRLDLADGRLEEALGKAALAARELKGSNMTGPPGYAQLMLATVHLARGDPSAAEGALANIKDVGKDLNPEDVSHYHRILSAHARARGSASESHRHAERALSVARERGDPLEEARSLEELATWESAFGSPDNATFLSQQADEIYKRIGVPPPRRRQ